MPCHLSPPTVSFGFVTGEFRRLAGIFLALIALMMVFRVAACVERVFAPEVRASLLREFTSAMLLLRDPLRATGVLNFTVSGRNVRPSAIDSRGAIPRIQVRDAGISGIKAEVNVANHQAQWLWIRKSLQPTCKPTQP
jgi:hypothetical protein